MKNTCGGCEAKWTGANMAHCGAASCHLTFSSVALFDLHRQGGECQDPATIFYGGRSSHAGEPRMKLNEHGVWVGTQKRPEFWESEVAA